MNNITYSIVIYNKHICNSVTFNCLLESGVNTQNIIIFDNSIDENSGLNKKFCEKNKIVYLTQGNNVGLSRAYNLIINFVRNSHNEYDYLVTLDDDTELNENYIRDLKSEVQSGNDIYIPVVLSQKMILSPSNLIFNCKIKQIRNTNEIKVEKLTGINSGLCIKISSFDSIIYDENLFLDCVDHDLFRQIRSNNLKIKILSNTFLFQNYSRNEDVPLENRLNRFRISTKDIHNYAKKFNIQYLFFFASEMRQSIIWDRKYHTKIFKKVYINEWFGWER